jgi:hypothetical protein
MQDQTTSPELPLEAATTTPAKPARVTLTRIEAFAVMEYLKKESDLATTPIDKIVQLVKLGTDIETTPGIITKMLKDMGVPHISFRSTPKPGAIDITAIASRIDGIDSRLEFVTGVVTDLTNRVRSMEESLALHERRLNDQSDHQVRTSQALQQEMTLIKSHIEKIDQDLSAITAHK